MGSPLSEPGRSDSETEHRVRITKPFYLSAHEVTQQQYAKVMGDRPWQGKEYVQEGPDYPATYVSWEDAVEFCRKLSEQEGVEYRLPTEAEWEYAARGGLEGATYPWGGPYTKNDRGCFMANFKPLRGDYAADQALYTVEADSYEPNDYDLYNMAGNVSEWVGSSYDPNAYEYISTMNPNVSDSKNERKVVRGGSWKDVAYLIQVSTRDYEYADSARSYIGFRTVQDYLGVEQDVNMRNGPSRR